MAEDAPGQIQPHDPWPAESPQKAPRPTGLLSGPRFGLRRLLSRAFSTMNRVLDRVPPGRQLHRLLQRRLRFPEVSVLLRRGAPELAGLRIAFLSDIHAGSYMGERDLVRIFAKVAEQGPDLVCLGGDMINTRERELLMFRAALREVDPPLGVFAVPGNHDHFWGRDIGLWKAFLEEQGVQVLDNQGLRLEYRGARFWLCGVDDLTEGEPDLRAALEGARADEPVVLLSHHPDFFFEAAAVGVDLTLSGHTHGGQIAPFGKPLLTHSRLGFSAGLYEQAEAQLYVSRGVGVTLLPLRWGAPAEVPILRFAQDG